MLGMIAARPIQLPNDSWLEPLTSGFAAGFDWRIDHDPMEPNGIAFWLHGMRADGRVVFQRREVLDFHEGTTLTGSFAIRSDLSGVRGMGTKYVANLAAFARDALGFGALRMHAGDTVGALFWARFAELDPMAVAVNTNEQSQLIEHLRKGLRLAKDDLPGEVWRRVNRQIDLLHDLSTPEARRALWVLADDDTLLSRNGEQSVSERFRNAAKYYKESVPLRAFLLPGANWHGIVKLNGGEPLARLNRLAARP